MKKISIYNEYHGDLDIRIICEWTEHFDGKKSLRIRGELIPETIKALQEREFDKLILEAGNWHDLKFNVDLIERVKFLHLGSGECNWEELGKLKNLESMYVGGWFKTKFDFKKFKKLKTLETYWNDGYENFYALPKLETLKLIGWKGDARDFSSLKSLKHIRFVNSRQIENLDGLGQCKELTYLDIYSSTKLVDCSDLTKCEKLKYLRLESCKKLTNIDFLEKMDLEELGLFTKSTIPSLSHIKKMKNLKVFAFGGGTKLADGDLSVLLNFKELGYIRIQNAKNFNPPLKEISSELKVQLMKNSESYIPFEVEGMCI